MTHKKQIQKYFGKKYINLLKTSLVNKVSEERKDFVRNNLIKTKKKINILEIGSGDGKLLKEFRKFIKTGIGIDISKSMADFSNKENKSKNIKFYQGDILTYKSDIKFDYIIAIGLVEYLKREKLIFFFKKIFNLLKINGVFLFTSRNRLFNILSLNNFTKNEIQNKTFKFLLEECILTSNTNIDQFIKKNKNLFKVNNFKKNLITDIMVNKREQYTPGQIASLIKNNTKFKIKDIEPLNLHLFNNSIHNLDTKTNKIILKKIKSKNNKMALLPNSSAFGIKLVK